MSKSGFNSSGLWNIFVRVRGNILQELRVNLFEVRFMEVINIMDENL